MLELIMEKHESEERLLTIRAKSALGIITKMYRKQKNDFRSIGSRKSSPNRIVSLSKTYLSPMLRNKSVKSVEFGSKVNKILVDGKSFIGKLSFNAFNEGLRLMHCPKMHKSLFIVNVKKVRGDTMMLCNAEYYKASWAG